jgi:hypothetical protein
MRKLFLLLGIMVTSLVLVGCNGSQDAVTPPSFTGIRVENANPVDGTELVRFYKQKESTVLVEISISNPSNLDIKSIVVNGYTYISSRFTEASTSTTIYFNVDVGTTLGEKIYSVDRINYLDGDNTKIVEGFENNEFSVYVFKEVPTVERENYQVTNETISIDFNITDTDGVIAPNTLKAVLYSGETLVAEQEIDKGLTTVEFLGLHANKHYEVKVVASYNLDDNTPTDTNVTLYSGTYSTIANGLPSSSVVNAEVTSNKVTFDVDFLDEAEVTVDGGLGVAIYNGETLVDVVNIMGSTLGLSFEDLLNDNDYSIQVLANYDLRDGGGIIEDNVLAIYYFTTLPREVPEPVVYNEFLSENIIDFDIAIDDPDGIIDEDTLYSKLYLEDVYIDSSEVINYHVDFQVNNMFAGQRITIEILADYDLNDGEGVQEDQVIYTFELSSVPRDMPIVNIIETIVEQGYVTVLLDVDDFGTINSPLTAKLFEGDTEVQTIVFGKGESELIFDYATKSGESYYVEIYSDYNLFDGTGKLEDQLLRRIVLYTVEAKAPIAEIFDVVTDKSSITFDVSVIDADLTIVGDSIVDLYLNGILVGTQNVPVGKTTVTFNNLLSNNEYAIIVTSSYDINDSSGVQTEPLISTNANTIEKEIPTSNVENIVSSDTSIMFDSNIFDDDSVIIPGTIVASIYHEDVLIDSSILTNGGNFGVEFTNLLSNNQYSLVISADYDLNDGLGLVEDFVLSESTVYTEPKELPTAEFTFKDSDETSIVVDIFVEDDFDVIHDNLKAVLYLNDVATGAEFDLNTGMNTGLTFTGLYSDERYYINIESDIDMNDGEAVLLSQLLEFDFIKTLSYGSIFAEITDISSTSTTITVSATVDASLGVITGNLRAALYKDGVATGITEPLIVGDNTVTFTGVESDTTFVVVVEADYDLNESSGAVIAGELDKLLVATLPLGPPSAVISSFENTFDSISASIVVYDEDNTVTNNTKAILYKDGISTGIERSLNVGENVVTFDTLLSNNEYEIRVFTDYDLNDDNGEQFGYELYSQITFTLQKNVPYITIQDLEITNSEVTFNYNLDDVDGVLTDNTVKASLWVDGIKQAEKLLLTNSVTFDIDGFLADFDFEIRITGDYDLNDGAGLVDDGIMKTLELSTEPYEAPSATIQEITINQNTINATITITDEDITHTQNLVATLYDQDMVKIADINLVIGLNEIEFNHIANYRELYTVVVTTDYNLRDGDGEQTGLELAEYLVSSYNKLLPQTLIDNVTLEEESITLDIELFDNHAVTTGNRVVHLFLNGVSQDSEVLLVGENNGIVFNGLLSNTNYEIIVLSDYDNDDGNGEFLGYIVQSDILSTDAKQVPTVTVSNIVEDDTVIDMDVTITDDSTVSSGRFARIYDEDSTLIQSIPLNVGVTSIQFTGLLSGNNYSVDIEMDYDLNDGEPSHDDQVISNLSVNTDFNAIPSAEVTYTNTTETTITFDVDVVDVDLVNTGGLRAVLMLDDVEQDSVNLVVGTNTSKQFTGVYSNDRYYILIEVDYDLRDGVNVVSDEKLDYVPVSTLSYDAPTATIDDITSTKTSIVVDVTIVDDDTRITGSADAVLYLSGIEQSRQSLTVGANTITFTLLDSDTLYEVRIESDYDLNEVTGSVIADELDISNLSTIPLDPPTGIVTNIETDFDTITFTANITDDDGVVTSGLSAVLYKDGIPTGTPIVLSAGVTTDSFTGLLAGNEYVIKLITNYDLQNGDGEIVGAELDSNTVSTDVKQVPTITISDEAITVSDVSFRYSLSDVDSVLTSGTVKASLWVGGVMQAEKLLFSDEVSFDVSGFLANFDFEIRITGDYDLDDGNGLQDDGSLTVLEFTTNAYVEPTANITTLDIYQNSIDLTVDVTDADGTAVGNIIAELYNESDVLLGSIALSVGVNTISFAETVNINELYSVIITTDYNLLDGNGNVADVVLDEYLLSAHNDLLPEAEVSNVVIGEESIAFDVDVFDNFTTLIGNLEAVLLLDGAEVTTEALIVGANSKSFTGLLSSRDYEIVIRIDYDNGNGNGTVVDYDMTSDVYTTTAKELPTASIILDDLTAIEIVFDIIIDDDSSVASSIEANLYDDDNVLVESKTLSVGNNLNVTYSGLIGNTRYTLEIEMDYDMNDGEGTITDVVNTFDQTTPVSVEPEGLILNTVESTSEVIVFYDFLDDDGVSTEQYIRVYDENDLLVSEVAIIEGEGQQSTLTGLAPNSAYTVKIESSYDLQDLDGLQTDQVLFDSNITTESIITISNQVVAKLNNELEVVVDDYETILTGAYITATLKQGATTIDTYVVSNEASTYLDMLNLLSGFDYVLEFSATYDVGSGNVTEVVYTHEFTTTPLDIPDVSLQNASAWTIAYAAGTGTVSADVTIATDTDNIANNTEWVGEIWVNGVHISSEDFDIDAAGAGSVCEGQTVTLAFANLTITSGDIITIVVVADVDMNDEAAVGEVATDMTSRTFIDAGN